MTSGAVLMPADVTGDPLGIACMFSDGTSARFALDGLPCPELARDLLAGLAELVHPHGTVDAAGSVEHYVASVRHMTRQLAAAGFTGGAAGLRRPQAARYWMAAPRPEGGMHPPDAAGVPGRRRAPGRRAWPNSRPAGPSTRSATTVSCRRTRRTSGHAWPAPADGIADESFAAHKQALAAAGRGRHPREHGWSGDNLRWLLARTGPVGIVAFGEHLGCSENVVRQRGGVLEASRDLFPGLDVVIAYRLLFGIYSGIVPDGIDDLVDRRHRLGRGLRDPAVLCQGPDRRREPEPATPGGPAARAVAGALGAAAQPRRPEQRGAPVAAAEQARRHRGVRESRCGQPGRGPALDRPPRRDRRRWQAAEDPPVQDPHHAPVDARQAHLGWARQGHHRPQPQPGGRRRPLPDRHHAVPAARRSRRSWRTPSTTCCAGPTRRRWSPTRTPPRSPATTRS